MTNIGDKYDSLGERKWIDSIEKGAGQARANLAAGRPARARSTWAGPRCAVVAATGGRPATAAGGSAFFFFVSAVPPDSRTVQLVCVGRRPRCPPARRRAHVESILRPARVGPALWWSVGGEWRGLCQVTSSESACRFPALLLLLLCPRLLTRASSQTP